MKTSQQQLVKEFRALPATAMPSARFTEEEDSWAHSPWDVLDRIARTGESALALCGTTIEIWADRPEWEPQTIR